MNKMAITVTRGPSLRAPFAAVIGQFGIPPAPLPDAATLTARLAAWLPASLCQRLNVAENSASLQHWLMHFAQTITESRGKMALPAVCGAHQQLAWVALGYCDAHATTQAMQFALTATLNAIGNTVADATLRRQATAVLRLQQQAQPDFQERALMRVARRRGMPVYPVVDGSLVWQYGQGGKAWQCVETSTQADSRTGMMLQRNKVQSNELVRRLGLPGVTHRIATRPQQAIACAQQLGYPLVVKPLDRGQGKGVTANINTPEDVVTAFRKAAAYSPQVIVERFVAGNDYRIMVMGGKFQWAIQRNPPDVTGDGQSSIAELIGRKNALIAKKDLDRGFVKHVVIDGEVQRVLALHQVTLDDRPAAGAVIPLRVNANVSTGGSYMDVTRHIHADNRAMAETLARAFRLDVVGVDFLTADIGRSWREGACAVIEVNATPMLFCDAHAEQWIDSKFADGENGRIPSVLLLCHSPAARDRALAELADLGPGVGVVTRTQASLDGCVRQFTRTTDAGAAAQALLLDPSCEALIVICTANEIRQRGMPLDRMDAGAWTEETEPDQALRELLYGSCNKAMKLPAGPLANAVRTFL